MKKDMKMENLRIKMKITKRIAKEVHNEKLKSYEEGYENGKSQRDTEEIEFLEKICCVESSDYRAIKERLSILKSRSKVE